MHLTVYEAVNRPEPSAALDCTWEELGEFLGKSIPLAAKIHGQGWAPHELSPGTSRAAANVLRVHAMVYDLDDGVSVGLADRLQPYTYYLHSTFTKGRYRLVLRTSRPHTPTEHAQLFGAVADLLEIPYDKQATDASRFFYQPAHELGATPEFYDNTGRPIDVDEVLKIPVLAPYREHPPAEQPLDLGPLGEAVPRVKDPESREIFRQLVARELAPKPGSQGGPGRDVSLHKAMCCLATAPQPAVSRDVAEHLLESTLDRMECSPEGRDYWRDKALSSFDRALEARLHRDSLTQAVRGQLQASIAPADQSDWRNQLIYRKDSAGNITGLEHLGFNLEVILENDPEFSTLRWNELRREIEVLDGPLQHIHSSAHDVALSNWLVQSKYKLKLSRQECAAQIYLVARSNPFDPVAQWLEGLTWDGTPRVRRAFHQYLNVVEGNPKHVATISEKFFVACVARALEPGCQVDTVLVLQGPQGVGKTSFVRILGGDFAAETSLDVANKDATMILTGSWLVELNELIAMKRSDVESMRAFITRRVDQFRPPYGRAVEHFPRRCVFIGTTNDDQPLNDPDGHRRYWPVMVGSIDRAALQRDRDQLFAEAVHLYRSGVAWWLSDEESLVAAEEAALFERGTLYGEVIDSWFRSLPAKQRPEYVTVLDISERVLRVVGAQVTTLIKNQIGEALTALGFEKSRRQGGDKLRTYLWKVPAYLLRCEQVKSSSLQKLADASFGLQQPKEEV